MPREEHSSSKEKPKEVEADPRMSELRSKVIHILKGKYFEEAVKGKRPVSLDDEESGLEMHENPYKGLPEEYVTLIEDIISDYHKFQTNRVYTYQGFKTIQKIKEEGELKSPGLEKLERDELESIDERARQTTDYFKSLIKSCEEDRIEGTLKGFANYIKAMNSYSNADKRIMKLLLKGFSEVTNSYSNAPDEHKEEYVQQGTLLFDTASDIMRLIFFRKLPNELRELRSGIKGLPDIPHWIGEINERIEDLQSKPVIDRILSVISAKRRRKKEERDEERNELVDVRTVLIDLLPLDTIGKHLTDGDKAWSDWRTWVEKETINKFGRDQGPSNNTF